MVRYPVLMWARESTLDLNHGCSHTPIIWSHIQIKKLEVYSSIWSLFRWDHSFRVTWVWSIKHSSTVYIIKDETVVILFSARITHPFPVLSLFVVLFSLEDGPVSAERRKQWPRLPPARTVPAFRRYNLRFQLRESRCAHRSGSFNSFVFRLFVVQKSISVNSVMFVFGSILRLLRTVDFCALIQLLTVVLCNSELISVAHCVGVNYWTYVGRSCHRWLVTDS